MSGSAADAHLESIDRGNQLGALMHTYACIRWLAIHLALGKGQVAARQHKRPGPSTHVDMTKRSSLYHVAMKTRHRANARPTECLEARTA